MIDADPLTVVLYGDVQPMSADTKKRMLEGLREEARQHPAFRSQTRQDHPFGALADRALTDYFRASLATEARDEASQSFVECIITALATSLAERTNVIQSSGLQRYPGLMKLVPVGALLPLLASLNVESFSGTAAADETPVTAAKDSAADSEIPVKVFAGRVLKPDGSNASGSQIVAVRYEPVGVFDHRLMTTADDQGVFSLKLPGVRGSVASWGVFAVLGDDGGMLETAIEVANPQSESNVHLPEAVTVIELKPGRKVQGTIIDDATQSPIPGAQVFSIDGRVETTGEQGRCQFRGLRADIIEFVVRSNGRQTLKFAVDASERRLTDVTHIEVPMSPGGMVRGRVVDPDGSPVPGATVHAAFARSVFSSVLASTTDEHGRFSLDALALNRMIFPLEVSVSGYDRGNGQMFAINRASATFETTLQIAKVTDAGSLRNSIGGGSETAEPGRDCRASHKGWCSGPQHPSASSSIAESSER